MLTFLIDRAAMLLNFMIIASVLLSMIGQAASASWLRHPLVRLIVAAGEAIYGPFRLMMRSVGLPTAPLDFSPMVAMFAISFTRDVLIRLLRGL